MWEKRKKRKKIVVYAYDSLRKGHAKEMLL